MLGPGNGARRRHDQAAELRPRLTLTTRGELETTSARVHRKGGGTQEALPGFQVHCESQRPEVGDARPRGDIDLRGTGLSTLIVLLFEERSVDKTERAASDLDRAIREMPSVRFRGLGIVAAMLRWIGATVLVLGLIGTALLTVQLYNDDTVDQAFAFSLASLISVVTTSGVMLGLGYFFDMSLAVADDIHLGLEAYLDDEAE